MAVLSLKVKEGLEKEVFSIFEVIKCVKSLSLHLTFYKAFIKDLKELEEYVAKVNNIFEHIAPVEPALIELQLKSLVVNQAIQTEELQ